MKLKRIGIASVALILVSLAGPLAQLELNTTGWWHRSWEHRTRVIIQEKSGKALENYQVRVIVSFRPGMRPDFGDIRFVDGGSLLPHWCESCVPGERAVFWVKVPSILAAATKRLEMYYGNPSAGPAASLSRTFVWADDFENNDRTSRHLHAVNLGGARQFVSGGAYHMSGPAGSQALAEIYEDDWPRQFGDSYVIEMSFLPVLRSGSAAALARYRDIGDGYQCLVDLATSAVTLSKVSGGSWNVVATSHSAPRLESRWYTLRLYVAKAGGDKKFQVYIDDTLSLSAADAGLPNSGAAILTFGNEQDFNVLYDDIRVRQVAAIEPVTFVSLDKEEDRLDFLLNRDIPRFEAAIAKLPVEPRPVIPAAVIGPAGQTASPAETSPPAVGNTPTPVYYDNAGGSDQPAPPASRPLPPTTPNPMPAPKPPETAVPPELPKSGVPVVSLPDPPKSDKDQVKPPAQASSEPRITAPQNSKAETSPGSGPGRSSDAKDDKSSGKGNDDGKEPAGGKSKQISEERDAKTPGAAESGVGATSTGTPQAQTEKAATKDLKDRDSADDERHAKDDDEDKDDKDDGKKNCSEKSSERNGKDKSDNKERGKGKSRD